MKTIATKRLSGRALLRILLAALIGMAIVVFAGGSSNPTLQDLPQIDQSTVPTDVALRSDRKLDAQKPQSPRQQRVEPNYPRRYELPNRRYPKPVPSWYDGIWGDPQFLRVVSNMA